MLGLYQRVLMDGEVGLDGSVEQLALRLTGVVVKRGDRLVVANRIYGEVFGLGWVAAKLGALRPYGEELRRWLEKRDEAWLLRGEELRKVQRWMGQDGLKLAPEDYQFVQASERLAARVELQTEQAARSSLEVEKKALEAEKQTLEVTNRKARRRVSLANVFVAASLLGLGGAALAWNIADIRILSMTAEDDYAGAKLQDAWVNGMTAYQRFQPLTVAERLNLAPYQVTENAVMTALQTSAYAEVQGVGRFIDSKLKQDIKTAYENPVVSVAWSPDGQTIASGSRDNTIKLWRRDGSLVTTLKGHENAVVSVAWSPDGQTIASGSYDNTIKLWPWRSADLFAMGCYWLQTSHSLDSSGLAGTCREPSVQSAIPTHLESQAQTHARNGNYSLAEAILRDIKTRNPNFNLPPALAAARKTASQALLTEARNRIIRPEQSSPPEGSFGSIKPNTPNFDFLSQAYLEEANFLVRRAKSIDPDLNLEKELKQVKERWQESVNQLKDNPSNPTSSDFKN